jgi:murein L,D-transpeptidase YcbB/YkuD
MKKLVAIIYVLLATIISSRIAIAQSRDSLISVEIKKQLSKNAITGLCYPKTIKRFYDQNKFKPAWIKPQPGEGHAWQAMLMLDCVLQYGLSHADYHPKELAYPLLHDILDTPGKINIKTQAWFDIMLTDATITFMNNLHFGKLNPYYANDRIDDGNINSFNADDVLMNALTQTDIMNPIAAVQPRSKEYLDMLNHMNLLKGKYDGDCYDVPETVIRKLAINMERMRWANIDQPTYIHINIPSYTLMFHQPDSTYLFKVIVGKPTNPTPTLLSEIKYFTTAPEWKVPASIFLNELLPKALADTNLITNKHFTIYDNKGNYVKPNAFNLAQIKTTPAAYTAIQSTSENALGTIVFRFPNIYNVYLHDTPEKSLFKKTDRAFSHGCIRVEQPEKLAGLILKNDNNKDKIARLHKNLMNYKTQTFNLKISLPIKITYLTCAVKEGVFITYKDIYSLDKDLEIALYGLKSR